MSLIGFRRKDGDVEYLEEVEYGEEYVEDDLHELIRNEPRLVMADLNARNNIVLGSKLQLPTGKELDLLTCGQRGTLTIIEFKRGRSPREAITQLFDYASSIERLDTDEFLDLIGYETTEDVYEAFDREEETEAEFSEFEQTFTAGIESPQLLLVAYSISADVRRMTRWLRDVHDLKINCVEFDYYERDDAEMYIPTVIGADETQEIRDREASRGKQKYRQFYGEVLERFKQELPGVTSRSPTSDSWLPIPTGHGDVEIVWHFKGDPGDKTLWVTVNFQTDDPERNQELQDTAYSKLTTDSVLDTDEANKAGEYGSSGYTRFYVEHPVGELDDALADEELKSWAVDTMVKLRTNLKPILDDEL